MKALRKCPFDYSYVILFVVALNAFLPWFTYRFNSIALLVAVFLWMLVHRHFVALPTKLNTLYFYLALGGLSIYGLLSNIYSVFDHGEVRGTSVLGGWFYSLALIYITKFSFVKGRIREMKIVSIVAMIALCVSMVFSRGAVNAGIEGARALAMGYEGELFDQGRLEAKMMGLGNYTFMYVNSLVVPSLLLIVIKAKGLIFKTIAGCSLLGAFYNLYAGGLGTPLFVLGYSLGLLAIWFLTRSRKTVIIVGWLMIILLFAFAITPVVFYPLSPIMQTLGDCWAEGSIKTRFLSLAEAFSGDKTTYAFQRYELQLRSWNTFCSNIVFGAGIYSFRTATQSYLDQVGGHSMMMDCLASSGIIGGMLLYGSLFCLYKFAMQICKRWFNEDVAMIYTITMLAFIFVSFANPFYFILSPLTIFILMFATLLIPTKFKNRL